MEYKINFLSQKKKKKRKKKGNFTYTKKWVHQICPRDTCERCPVIGTKEHSREIPIHKKSHTYLQNTKDGQSVNVSKKLACILPLFARPSTTEFASRHMWCRWTTHSLLRSNLQSGIIGNNSEAKFPEEVRHVRTKWN